MRLPFLLLLLCGFSAQAVVPQTTPEPPAASLSQLDTPTAPGAPELISLLHPRAGQAGQQVDIRTELAICDRCHQAGMHSENSYLPVLQGQNAEYLIAKILYFRNSERSFHPMRAVTRSLSDAQIISLGRYYSEQAGPLRKSLLLARFAAPQGDNSALSGCATCHGRDGNGKQLIPAISGQNENYLGYRIREIARQDSRVHGASLAAISCEIPQIDLPGSRRPARQFALVLEPERIVRGQLVYSENCARCHDQGEQGAPKLSDRDAWQQRMHRGTRELVRSTVMGKQAMPFWGGNVHLSRNQLKDAIHFMLDQASQPGL